MRTALCVLTMLASTNAAAGEPSGAGSEKQSFFAWDILVGETLSLAPGAWNLSKNDADCNPLNLGTLTTHDASHFIGAGPGLEFIWGAANGFRVSSAINFFFGRMLDGPGAAWPGAVTRFETYGTIGYQRTLGAVTLHAAAVVGYQDTQFQLDGAGVGRAGVEVTADRGQLLFGQQIGVHVQVAPAALLFATGTVDLDGEWRVQIGIGFGGPIHHETAAVTDPDLSELKRTQDRMSTVIEQLNQQLSDQQVHLHAAPGSTINVAVDAERDAHLHIDAAPGSTVNVQAHAASVHVESHGDGEIDVTQHRDETAQELLQRYGITP